MKKNSKLICLILGFVLLLIASCTKDDTNSNTDPRDQFVGSWTHVEKSQSFGTTTYSISISKANDNTNVIVKNFYQLGSGTNSIVEVSDNNLIIGQQVVSGQNIHGGGTFSSNKINWTYYTDDGVQKDTCTAVSTKQ